MCPMSFKSGSCPALSCIVLKVLHSPAFVLQCPAFSCPVLHFPALPCIVAKCPALSCVPMHCPAVSYTAFHGNASPCTARNRLALALP